MPIKVGFLVNTLKIFFDIAIHKNLVCNVKALLIAI